MMPAAGRLREPLEDPAPAHTIALQGHDLELEPHRTELMQPFDETCSFLGSLPTLIRGVTIGDQPQGARPKLLAPGVEGPDLAICGLDIHAAVERAGTQSVTNRATDGYRPRSPPQTTNRPLTTGDQSHLLANPYRPQEAREAIARTRQEIVLHRGTCVQQDQMVRDARLTGELEQRPDFLWATPHRARVRRERAVETEWHH
jgi:hypothetical protein